MRFLIPWVACVLALGTLKANTLQITVLDSQHKVVVGAVVALDGANLQTTDTAGHVSFPEIKPGPHTLSISKPTFESRTGLSLIITSETSALEFTLSPEQHHDEVSVSASADKLETNSAGNQVAAASAKQLPGRPATVSDVLPLAPGITRSPQGGLNISGSGEQRSALIVNSADVTDPATGQFGTTIPVDSVESLNILQTPFLAEYGRFTSALVSVETRRGGDKWKAELNDPLPDFRIRSYHLRGIRDATPRLNFEGPLVKNKLFFSEGFEYEDRKTEVITLPFPNNQQIKQGFNSFSQIDYILSSSNLLTATLHVAPTQPANVNLSTFNPRSAAPDASLHNYTGTIGDKQSLFHGDELETTFSYTRFIANVWGHGSDPLVITPSGNEGNYFAQQQRDSARLSVASTYSLHALEFIGEHHIKVGAYFAPSSENGQVSERAFSIVDTGGNLVQQTTFTGGRPVKQSDTEIALFVQDHWLVTPRFAIDAGVRTESQELTETLRLAPRVGFAWTPLGSDGPVIRAGAGLFYDRVPLDVFSFSEYPNRIVTIPGDLPITYVNLLGSVISRNPFVFEKQGVGDFSPHSTTWSFQAEQQVQTWLKLKLSYVQNVSSGLILMNPVPPADNSLTGTMLLTGDGQSRYRQFELGGRIRVLGEKRQLFFSYVKSKARGDLNDFSNYLGSFPTPLIRPNQFSNQSGDVPNRFLVWGLLNLPWKFRIAPIFEWRNGFPYSLVDAAQSYIGVPNSQRFPHFLSLDARISKDFKINPKYSVRFSVSTNNATNHFNPDSVYANNDAPLYGQFLGQHKRRFMVDFDFLF